MMKYDIVSLKRKMLIKYPFFGRVVSNVKYVEDKDVGTAATDGEKIYYNPEFLNSLNNDEQLFILAHEVCHIAFNHISRSKDKNKEVWNIATDAVINQFLKRDGLQAVKGCVDLEDAINYDAEEYYNKLLSDAKNKESSSGDNNGSNKSNKENLKGHDNHDMWKKATKTSSSQVKNNQDECVELGEKSAFNENTREKKKKLQDLKKEINKIAKTAGSSTNSEIRNIKDIGNSKPIVDWRMILRESISYNIDWSYRNATIEDGVLSPTLERYKTPETEILLDTSGSIDEELLRGFLRECKNILKYSKIKVGCFDTKFYGFHNIRSNSDIENMEFLGGGGTSFDIAVDSFSRRVDNKIIFTDGFASMPSTPLNAVWIVFGGVNIDPPGGKVINISREQLDDLYTCSFEKVKTR